MSEGTVRLRLKEIITTYVLKQNRTELWQAIADYIKERDDALKYFIPKQVGPFQVEWEEVK